MNNLIEALSMQGYLILVLVSLIPAIYIILFSYREKDERGLKIMNTAYRYTYVIILLGILLIFIIEKFTRMSFAEFKISIFILAVVSNLFLGSSIFILNKKY